MGIPAAPSRLVTVPVRLAGGRHARLGLDELLGRLDEVPDVDASRVDVRAGWRRVLLGVLLAAESAGVSPERFVEMHAGAFLDSTFWQVPGLLADGTDRSPRPVAVLDWSAAMNGETLLDDRTASDFTPVAIDEAIDLVVACQVFAPGGLLSAPGVERYGADGPYAARIVRWPVAASLGRSLELLARSYRLPFADLDVSGDRCNWTHRPSEVASGRRDARGPLDVLSTYCRHIALERDGEVVSSAVVTAGSVPRAWPTTIEMATNARGIPVPLSPGASIWPAVFEASTWAVADEPDVFGVEVVAFAHTPANSVVHGSIAAWCVRDGRERDVALVRAATDAATRMAGAWRKSRPVVTSRVMSVVDRFLERWCSGARVTADEAIGELVADLSVVVSRDEQHRLAGLERAVARARLELVDA